MIKLIHSSDGKDKKFTVTTEGGGVVNDKPIFVDKEVDLGKLENIANIIKITTIKKEGDFFYTANLLFSDDNNNIYIMIVINDGTTFSYKKLWLCKELGLQNIKIKDEYKFDNTIMEVDFENMAVMMSDKLVKVVCLTNDEVNNYDE